MCYKYLFAGIIMFACCMLVRLVLTGFICFAIQIIIGICVYFGILILFRDEFVLLIINEIRGKISKI